MGKTYFIYGSFSDFHHGFIRDLIENKTDICRFKAINMNSMCVHADVWTFYRLPFLVFKSAIKTDK